MRRSDPATLLDAARTGDRGAVARLLSLVERGGAPAHEVGRLCHPLSGTATTIGITGAPGSGKSTLTNALLARFRKAGERVGVLAIDPSSPFTGGAILGDRVRMGDHVLDDGVFIRSMATRGHLGGLALAAPEAIRVLDAVGTDRVVIETVGVGQVEVEIVDAADTTVVVVNPGWGDAVQANKAGLMEIADVFVVNKADRAGADDTRRDLEGMLDLTEAGGWRPPVVAAAATAGDGVDDVVYALDDHRAHLAAEGRLEAKRARRLRDELDAVVTERLRHKALRLLPPGTREEVEAAVIARELDPWSAADRLLGDIA